MENHDQIVRIRICTLRWLITMMVTIKDKTMREERTPMVIIVLVFICPFSSQYRDRPRFMFLIMRIFI